MPLVNDNTSGSDVINDAAWITLLRSYVLDDLVGQNGLCWHREVANGFQVTSKCRRYLKRLNAEPVVSSAANTFATYPSG